MRVSKESKVLRGGDDSEESYCDSYIQSHYCFFVTVVVWRIWRRAGGGEELEYIADSPLLGLSAKGLTLQPRA